MKKFVAGVAIALLACFSTISAQAQQRDGGYRGSRGRGVAEQPRGSRGRGRGGQRRYWNTRRPGYRYEPGLGWYDPNVAIGTAIGTGIANWLFRPKAEPEYAEEEQPVGGMAYCIDRYKSYDANPRSPTYGTYLGYDGQRHPCPK